MKQISYKISDLKGKKILNVEVMRAEFGRTYDSYICFTLENNERVLVHGGEVCNPRPTIEGMRSVNFYTPEEIGKKVELEEATKRREKENELDKKRRDFERLKKELGE